MMTPDEERKLEDLIQGSVYPFTSNGGEERWQSNTDPVIEYVNGLLAERDAEIERLQTRVEDRVIEQRPYNLNRPAHLIAGQVIRDIEAIAMVKFGPQSSGPIHRLVEQYQDLLSQRDQKTTQPQKAARKKTSNAHFAFLYPGWDGDGMPLDGAAYIAIPNGGEFVSVCGEEYGGEQPCAVFNSPQSLRDLASVLEEAADLFEQNRSKARQARQDRHK